MRRPSLLLVSCLLVAACGTSDRVPLSYRLEPGRRLEHRLVLEAQISRSLQGQTRDEHVVATFLATQEIGRTLPDGGAEATVQLVPESLTVDDRAVDPGGDQEFLIQLGADGRVVSIQEPDAPPDQALQEVGIERLLPQLRPVLPGFPVRPGDTWQASTEFVDETGRFSLSTRSRLDRLGRAEGRDAALVQTTYESPVDRQETFANAIAAVEGRDVGAQRAWFALDGFLVRSEGDSVGSYQVRFSQPGGDVAVAPVEASLVVRLHTEMQLLAGPSSAA